MQCKICNDGKEILPAVFHFHLNKIHNGMSREEYYRKYIKKENEGKCQHCGNETEYISITRGFKKHCSMKCASNNIETKKNYKQTNQKKYGVDNIFKFKDFIKKSKETKYKKYGDENYVNKEKAKETCLERYNDENYGCFGSKRHKEALFEKYGVTHNSQIPGVLEKSKESKKERYNDENYNNREKAKETCLEKYKVDHYTKTEEYKEKIKDIWDNKSEKEILEITEKRNKTFKEKHPGLTRFDFIIKGIKEKYGIEIENISQIPEINEKIRKTKQNTPYEIKRQRYDEALETFKKNNNIKENITNVSQTDIWLNKTKETWNNKTEEELNNLYIKKVNNYLKRLGVRWHTSSKEYIEKRIKSGKMIPFEKRNLYERYQYLVWQETKKWVKELFKNWNGLCYYTGQKLITSNEFRKIYKIAKTKNKMQPTVDHKISIIYGFNNNIDSKIIGNIENLCICSRKINSMKNYKIEEDFNIYLVNKLLSI